MKKQVIISIAVCTVFLLSSSSIYSQNQDSKKMVAVLKTGGKSLSDEIKGNITVQFEDGVLNSGEYQLLPYSDIYQKEVDAIKQDLVSGTVSAEQLTRLGQAVGADLVYYPIVDKYSDDNFRMAYKLVDVASGKIISIGSKTVRDGTEGLLAAAGSISQKLFGGDASESVSQDPINRTNNHPVDRSGEEKTNNATAVSGVSQNTTNTPVVAGSTQNTSHEPVVAHTTQNTINGPLTDEAAKNLAPIEGKAIVYFIRPSSLAKLVTIGVECDGNGLGSTKPKQYIYAILDPGKHTFTSHTENHASLDLTLEAGKIYYIQQKIKVGLVVARVGLEVMNESDGRKALNDCKLSSDILHGETVSEDVKRVYYP